MRYPTSSPLVFSTSKRPPTPAGTSCTADSIAAKSASQAHPWHQGTNEHAGCVRHRTVQANTRDVGRAERIGLNFGTSFGDGFGQSVHGFGIGWIDEVDSASAGSCPTGGFIPHRNGPLRRIMSSCVKPPQPLGHRATHRVSPLWVPIGTPRSSTGSVRRRGIRRRRQFGAFEFTAPGAFGAGLGGLLLQEGFDGVAVLGCIIKVRPSTMR